MNATIAGATIAFDDVGSGTPIVFLHAFPLDRTMWAPQVHALSTRSRCIVPDLRGFGASSAAPPWSVDRYADDVAAILDTAQVQRAVVVGLSLGGYVAFALWRRHRERVRAFVFADTRATADTAEAIERRRALIETARTGGSAAVAARQIETLVGRTTRERNPELCRAIRATMDAAPVPGIVGALDAMMARPDSTATLATIDVPTLFVVGEEDTVTPVADARGMQALVPNSRLAIVPRAGHLSNVEQPDAFDFAVDEFLRALLRPGSSAV